MPKTRQLVTDNSGVQFYQHVVDGHSYPDAPYFKDADYREQLQRIKNLDIRPDDVIMTAFPKSGNHWIFETVTMVLNHTTDYTKTWLVNEMIEFRTPEELEAMRNRPSPRLINTHLSMIDLPKQIPEKGAKLIYVVRNFKDVMSSAYKWIMSVVMYLNYRGKWEDFLDLSVKGKLAYDGWFNHVKCVDDFMKEHPEVPVHVVFYEKMKLNPVEEIRKLCHFLDRPDDLAEQMAAKLEFSAMRAGVTKFDEWAKVMCEPGSVGLMRKGINGDWKNRFTQEQSDAVNQKFLETVADTAIGQELRPFMGL